MNSSHGATVVATSRASIAVDIDLVAQDGR